MTLSADISDGSLDRIRLRRGLLSDVADLRSIECAVFDLEQLTTRSFRRYLRLERADLVVACRGNELVGYGLATYRRGSTSGRLLSIAVATRASGRGIGAALLSNLETAACGRSAQTMRLEVRRDNHAGLSLYRRAGYRDVGIKPAYYADFCDAIVMEHRL